MKTKNKSLLGPCGREQDVNAKNAPQGIDLKGEIHFLTQDVNAKKNNMRMAENTEVIGYVENRQNPSSRRQSIPTRLHGHDGYEDYKIEQN